MLEKSADGRGVGGRERNERSSREGASERPAARKRARNEMSMNMDEEASPEKQAQDNKPDLALDLNFVPTWARTPPENPYARHEDGGEYERDRERDRRPGGRDRRPGSFRRPEGGERRGPRRDGGSWGGGRREDRPRPGGRSGPPREGGRPPRGAEQDRRGPRRDGERRRDDRRPPREALPRLNVKVSFLPDRERLALVVRDIQASRRAYPLIEIAQRFLSREDSYLVKLEMPPAEAGQPRPVLVQCLECKRVFRHRANAEAHVLHDHLDKFFTIEEVDCEPPAGNFTFVARCGLSGTLLGPPNHHGYNEQIQELWSRRFAHMSKAEYLGHIETVRDEALVEQWKDSLRKKTTYRLTTVPEGQEAETWTRAQAQEWMSAGKVNGLLRESGRCLLPAHQSKKFDDGSLRQAVSLAWQRESRFPFTLSLALRPAFRHMRLHLFKVNARETYVTAVLPKPVDPNTAPALVKEIVDYIEQHPGVTRQQVLEGLRPGRNPEEADAAELLLHLSNQVATGGVIEFFNATLALPRGGAEAKPTATGGKAEPAAPTVTETGDPAELAAEPAADTAPEALPEATAEIVPEAADVSEPALPAEPVQSVTEPVPESVPATPSSELQPE